jgi:hypothetical protein
MTGFGFKGHIIAILAVGHGRSELILELSPPGYVPGGPRDDRSAVTIPESVRQIMTGTFEVAAGWIAVAITE